MIKLDEDFYPGSVYKTDPTKVRKSRFIFNTSLFFYYDLMVRMTVHLLRGRKTKKKSYRWSSYRVLHMAEKRGADVEITGIENISEENGPYIVAGNHMSMMETFILFYIFHGPISYVLKDTLLKIPFFRRFLSDNDCIPVTRKHPGKDMMTVFSEGKKRLDDGRSVILFPEGTRHLDFDPLRFNSMGVKLALRTGYPVVPMAVKTDFWGNGKIISYFGKLRPEKPVRIAFGKPIVPKGKGKEAHQECVDFITSKMKEWNVHVVEGDKQ